MSKFIKVFLSVVLLTTAAFMANLASIKQKPTCPPNTKKLINFATPDNYIPVTDLTSVCELYINLDTESGDLQFTKLLSDLNKYPNLKILLISDIPNNTKIVDLPSTLWNLHKLQQISFTYINFKDVTLSGIKKLNKLKELQIYGTNLKIIPPSFGKLTTLIKLDLSANGISTLPQEIGGLQNLTSLELSHNNLSSLPDNLDKLDKLKNINLWNNQFTMIPIVITRLVGLEEINLNTNKVVSIPNEIGRLKKLKKLYLSNWPTYSKYCRGTICRRDIEYFKNTGNRISDVPDSLFKLPLLEELDITNNPISIETKNRLKTMMPHVKISTDPPIPIDNYDR